MHEERCSCAYELVPKFNCHKYRLIPCHIGVSVAALPRCQPKAFNGPSLPALGFPYQLPLRLSNITNGGIGWRLQWQSYASNFYDNLCWCGTMMSTLCQLLLLLHQLTRPTAALSVSVASCQLPAASCEFEFDFSLGRRSFRFSFCCCCCCFCCATLNFRVSEFVAMIYECLLQAGNALLTIAPAITTTTTIWTNAQLSNNSPAAPPPPSLAAVSLINVVIHPGRMHGFHSIPFLGAQISCASSGGNKTVALLGSHW